FLVVALGKDQTRLPVIGAVEHDEQAARPDATQQAARKIQILRKAGQSKPEDVHGRRSFYRLKTCELTQLREAAVGADGERCANFVPSIVGAKVSHAADDAAFLDQLFDVGVHDQTKSRIFGGLTRDELQKLRLRHQHDVREFGFES